MSTHFRQLYKASCDIHAKMTQARSLLHRILERAENHLSNLTCDVSLKVDRKGNFLAEQPDIHQEGARLSKDLTKLQSEIRSWSDELSKLQGSV